ncbi:MAG: DUF1127 domain-containing protein [Pontibacterium sp.]
MSIIVFVNNDPYDLKEGETMCIKTSVKNIYRSYQQAFRKQRGRRQLLQLDQHALHDMGISRADALKEGQRHFWQ